MPILVLEGLAVVMLMAPGTQCSLSALPGLARQYNAAIRPESTTPPAATLAEFQQIAASVLGESPDPHVDWSTRTDLPCDTSVRRRDRVAWQMAMVGHSAREIADVLRGNLTVADLNNARARLMAGFTRAQVADYLESRWREPVEALPGTKLERHATLPGDIDIELERLAREYRVPPTLARAMVRAESGGNPRAVSRAGAIGLMQLMPATAAALGVDPWHPLENLRGGIQYLAELLRAYDQNTRLALIAYNAGPQHANRVRAGTAVAYRETRKYLDAISSAYPLP